MVLYIPTGSVYDVGIPRAAAEARGNHGHHV